jgi:DNA-binding winged helix-turn-helix (wHTH) protein
MPRFTFGPFLLDLETRALLRDGEPLAIAGRTLDTLVVLLQNRGRLLEKDELLSLIWPGTVVDEANLSQSIFTLRKLLGDSPKHHRYIATIAGRGYQFVAPVTELTTETSPSTNVDLNPLPPAEPELPIKGSRMRRRRYIIASVIASVLAAAVVFWFARHRPADAPSEFVERRLTFNSSANAVGSAVISPDGKYLAYSDPAGIHIRLLSTGEERLIPASAVAPAGASSWVDSWFPNGTELLGQSSESGNHVRMWVISIMGQSQRELRADAAGWSVSPDGSRIAFSPVIAGRNQPELWVMDERGEHPQKIVGLTAGEFLWSRAVVAGRTAPRLYQGAARAAIIRNL